jgi:hypothetical protein
MGWTEVPGGGQTTDAPAAVLFEDRIWVFVRAGDGSVWANNRGDEADWQGWEQIGPAGTLLSAPAAVVKGGGLYLFGRGPGDTIQMLSRGEWQGWS